MNTPTILKKILATKAEEVALRSKTLPLAEIKAQALDCDPAELRGFYNAMLAKVEAGKPAVIAEVKKVINFVKIQNGCYFSRITGSGSACIGIFSSMQTAVFTQKLIKLKFPKYWCVVSKTI